MRGLSAAPIRPACRPMRRAHTADGLPRYVQAHTRGSNNLADLSDKLSIQTKTIIWNLRIPKSRTSKDMSDELRKALPDIEEFEKITGI